MTFPRLVLITDISFLVPGISVLKAACGKIPRTVKRNNLTLDKALLKRGKKKVAQLPLSIQSPL